ncbi:probable aquaporin NIP7-1 [Coffea eugenioides]|uniref:probable aquaporin NIP7-1 n=1 Tax=Coffea eugenioides TaxID=49369 RepID=UPI000F606217|nr:probable aquaporin NIP7-1 [Coffea eugenioides]
MKSLPEDPPTLDVSIDALVSNQLKNDQEMGTDAKPISGEPLQENQSFRGFPRAMCPGLRKVLAEAVGTFILVFCICGIIASMELMKGQIGLMEYATTAALTVVVLVYAIGTISGAHVNPAITIAFATVGPFPWSTIVVKVPLYLSAQLGGAVLATYAGKFVYGLQTDLVLTKPFHGRSAAAFSVEFIATSMVVFLAAALANAPESVQNLSGFVVGGAIGLGVLITGPISGASMNPARSLGPAIVSGDFTFLWIYLAAPTLGAIFGAILYRLIRLQGWPCQPSPSKN